MFSKQEVGTVRLGNGGRGILGYTQCKLHLKDDEISQETKVLLLKLWNDGATKEALLTHPGSEGAGIVGVGAGPCCSAHLLTTSTCRDWCG